MNLITEASSYYRDLEKMNISDLLLNINREDQKVALAVQQSIPQIEKLVATIVDKMKTGGRLFYIGAGTSGRLGVLDASEIPPTYGLDHGHVIGVIAGGDTAIRNSVEKAEDELDGAWKDLAPHKISARDVLVGIAASGRTPYVIGGFREARAHGIATGCITCNSNAEMIGECDFPIVVEVGPEFVTGSTRMKAGTAQKLVLNMISTSVMIQMGRVKDNKMVDMMLSNDKLVDRAIRMVVDELGVDKERAAELLKKYGNVRAVIEAYNKK